VHHPFAPCDRLQQPAPRDRDAERGALDIGPAAVDHGEVVADHLETGVKFATSGANAPVCRIERVAGHWETCAARESGASR